VFLVYLLLEWSATSSVTLSVWNHGECVLIVGEDEVEHMWVLILVLGFW
jgi:hypothetical protein